MIEDLEEFYCSRMSYLIDQERYDDAHSIFEEFVVNDEEPEEFLYIGVGDI
jgi:pentatricopeptide repeat protein